MVRADCRFSVAGDLRCVVDVTNAEEVHGGRSSGPYHVIHITLCTPPRRHIGCTSFDETTINVTACGKRAITQVVISAVYQWSRCEKASAASMGKARPLDEGIEEGLAEPAKTSDQDKSMEPRRRACAASLHTTARLRGNNFC